MASAKKIAGAFLMLFLTGCGSDALGDKYVSFAQCLTDKDAKMYGAFWCPHCENQKALFGKEGVKKITYIECDARGAGAKPELCAQKTIKSYPTWIFKDGSRVTGEQSLEELGLRTTCELPKEDATATTESATSPTTESSTAPVSTLPATTAPATMSTTPAT